MRASRPASGPKNSMRREYFSALKWIAKPWSSFMRDRTAWIVLIAAVAFFATIRDGLAQIVALGASATAGYGLAPSESFPSQLQAMLQACAAPVQRRRHLPATSRPSHPGYRCDRPDQISGKSRHAAARSYSPDGRGESSSGSAVDGVDPLGRTGFELPNFMPPMMYVFPMLARSCRRTELRQSQASVRWRRSTRCAA